MSKFKKRRYVRRSRKLRSAGDAIGDLIDRHGGGNVRKRMELWANWEQIMGPGVASLGSPLDVKGKTLIVGADNNMALQELNMQAPYIVERANAYLEEKTFSRVTFTLLQGREPLTGRPQAPKMEKFKPKTAPPLPPIGFGNLKDKIDLDSPVGRCYKAVHNLYFPPDES